MNITKNDHERMLEYHRIAVESKLIIEGIQKTLGVFTTTEALQKIAALEAVADAAERNIEKSNHDEACNWFITGRCICGFLALEEALNALHGVKE